VEKQTGSVQIEYFTDVLCIWAYAGQARIDELRRNFGPRLEIRYRFFPLFGAAHARIDEGWRNQGGIQAFNRHLSEVASQWTHIAIHPEIWLKTAPASSVPAHLFLKAIQLLEARGEMQTNNTATAPGRNAFEEAVWHIRERFFQDGEDVATRRVQEDIARGLGFSVDQIWDLIDSGEAHAELHLDMLAKEQHQIPGSPCLVLNDGRQQLYGNVGYRIMEANVTQLLSDPDFGAASWC
jgi:predicted DsbA family dithiol-disulfide isomerase